MIKIVIFEDVTKVYPNEVVAVNKINLEVKKAELMVLIGPSGCGKTTTLKMVNRLIYPTSGTIKMNGINTEDLDPVKLRRDTGYVIQSGGLFPHKTVAANIAVVPKLKKWDKAKIRNRIDELLNMVSMDPNVYRDRYPKELSGGQQQRIGVLRALAARPDVILMDEPFGALDPITRDQLQDELKKLQQKVQKTILFVTHDMNEALKVADRIAVLKDGEIVQLATPKDLMANPANDFVRDFVGQGKQDYKDEITDVSSIMMTEFVSAQSSESVNDLIKEKQVSEETIIVTDDNNKYLGTAEIFKGKQASEDVLLSDILVASAAIGENEDAKAAIQLMCDEDVQFLPVVGKDNSVVGIITQGSVYSYILKNML